MARFKACSVRQNETFSRFWNVTKCHKFMGRLMLQNVTK